MKTRIHQKFWSRRFRRPSNINSESTKSIVFRIGTNQTYPKKLLYNESEVGKWGVEKKWLLSIWECFTWSIKMQFVKSMRDENLECVWSVILTYQILKNTRLCRDRNIFSNQTKISYKQLVFNSPWGMRISPKFAKPSAFQSRRFRRPSKVTKTTTYGNLGITKHEFRIYQVYWVNEETIPFWMTTAFCISMQQYCQV